MTEEMVEPRFGSWKKSTRTQGANNCVEIAYEAVEVAAAPARVVGIRDSKNPHGPVLTFSPERFTAFLADAKAGRFNG